MTTFAQYLRDLRRRSGLTLREVADASQGMISNAYLSQVETGRRPPPHVRILKTLASVYSVPQEEMLERAGYISSPSGTAIEVAFEQVLADRTMNFGTRFDGELNVEAKRMIVTLYERATGKRLLAGPEQDE